MNVKSLHSCPHEVYQHKVVEEGPDKGTKDVTINALCSTNAFRVMGNKESGIESNEGQGGVQNDLALDGRPQSSECEEQRTCTKIRTECKLNGRFVNFKQVCLSH